MNRSDSSKVPVSADRMSSRAIPIVALSEMIHGQEGGPVRADDGQGRAQNARRQALLQGRLSRPRPRGQLSHLARFALGSRLPRGLAARRVLQAAGRLSRDELRSAVGNPQDSRDLRRGLGRRVFARHVHPADALRLPGDVRRAGGNCPRADRRFGATRPGRGHSGGQSRAAAHAARGDAQSPRVRRRLPGARAERHADLRLFGRQVRRLLPRHASRR